MKYLPLFIVLALALSMGIFDYFYLISPSAPFCWDEAHHSTYSLLIAKSLAAGDIGSFWKHTHNQTYWPFFHSWVSAPFLLIGGYTFAAARLSSCLLGALSLFLTFLVGKKVAGKGAGLLSTILLALSPMYHLFSSTAMMENLGMVLTLIVVLGLFKSEEKQSWAYSLATGVAIAFLYLTKYIYGAFFAAGLVIYIFSLLFSKGEGNDPKQTWKTIPGLIGGFLLIWGIWVLIPPSQPKLEMFFYRITDTGGWNPFGYSKLDNRFFFVRALYYAYGFSVATYLLYLGGVIFGVARWKNNKLRLLLCLFLVNFLPMSAIVNSQERFIYLGFAPLTILAGSGVVWVWARTKKSLRWSLVALLIVLAAGDAHKLPHIFLQISNAVMGANLHPDQMCLDYSTFFGLAQAPKWIRYPKQYFNPLAQTKMAGDTSEVISYVQTRLDPRYPLCATGPIGTLPPHIWHWYAILTGRPITTAVNPNCAFFFTIGVDKTSPYNRWANRHLVDGTKKWGIYYQNLVKEGVLKQIDSRYFPETGLTAKIFARIARPNHPGWKKVGPHP